MPLELYFGNRVDDFGQLLKGTWWDGYLPVSPYHLFLNFVSYGWKKEGSIKNNLSKMSSNEFSYY